VVRVVVALTGLDVVGEFLGYGGGVLAVLGDEVGDVVADHAAEPAALVARVGERLGRVVLGDVGGAATQILTSDGVAPGGDGRVLHRP
jgi:hypothetical protein